MHAFEVSNLKACIEISCHSLAVICLHGYEHPLQRPEGGLKVFWPLASPGSGTMSPLCGNRSIAVDNFKPPTASNKEIELCGITPRQDTFGKGC
jgi:hypothetical protein